MSAHGTRGGRWDGSGGGEPVTSLLRPLTGSCPSSSMRRFGPDCRDPRPSLLGAFGTPCHVVVPAGPQERVDVPLRVEPDLREVVGDPTVRAQVLLLGGFLRARHARVEGVRLADGLELLRVT